MRTKSLWGKAPSRIYRFVEFCEKKLGNNADVCIIGCSDGKFVFPFLRKGFSVTGIEIDNIAIYGGEKVGPVIQTSIHQQEYFPSMHRPSYVACESQKYNVIGIKQRAELEGVSKKLSIIKEDFYHTPTNKSFDIVFTSCSMQYKSNRDISLEQAVSSLKNAVLPGGILYMDYMLPLEDRHEWKSSLFPRTGELKNFFNSGWDIIFNREMAKPVFEAAHIDRPEDHFHRFGYILAIKER